MGKQWKYWQTLFSWASKLLEMVTEAMKLKDACSLKEKLWPLDSILKSRGITLPAEVHIVKAMVFPIVMHGSASWTIKKAECPRIHTLELWCWRRLLRVSWASRRSNQSILKEVSPEYSLEGLMLKLKLQYFVYLMGRRPWCWRRLKAGEGDTRGWDAWIISPPLWTWVWASSKSWWWTGKPDMRQSIGLQRVRHSWTT